MNKSNKEKIAKAINELDRRNDTYQKALKLKRERLDFLFNDPIVNLN